MGFVIGLDADDQHAKNHKFTAASDAPMVFDGNIAGTLRSRTRESIVAHANQRGGMATRPGYTPAQPSWLSKPVIHNVAEHIATQLGYLPGSELSDVVERVGGRVTVESTLLLDPQHTGSLYVNGPDDFEIIVPSHTSLVRDRFTIAHELGHYYLHYVWPRENGQPVPDRVVALRKGSNRIEWEANWFAAAFLMPAVRFRAAFIQNNGSLLTLGQEFEVSAKAAEIRAGDLGL